MHQALGNTYDHDRLITILYEEGIPLYSVPNADIVKRLYDSPSSLGRRQILSRQLENIATDCKNILCKNSHYNQERTTSMLIGEAIAVIKEGYLGAGISLLSSVLDELTKHLDKSDIDKIKPNKNDHKDMDIRYRGKPVVSLVEGYKTLPTRIALLPLMSAFRQVWGRSEDGFILQGYSRHLTAHHPSSRIFSKSNAAQALLCATSLASYVYHWDSKDPDYRIED